MAALLLVCPLSAEDIVVLPKSDFSESGKWWARSSRACMPSGKHGVKQMDRMRGCLRVCMTAE